MNYLKGFGQFILAILILYMMFAFPQWRGIEQIKIQNEQLKDQNILSACHTIREYKDHSADVPKPCSDAYAKYTGYTLVNPPYVK